MGVKMFNKKVTKSFTEQELECLRSALSDHIILIRKSLDWRGDFKGTDAFETSLKKELKLSKKLEKKLSK
jgi:hypothetical protein